MTETKKRKRDKAEKIYKIMETAKKMIAEEGYAATNTNRIAKEANVSIGLVYKYFPDGKAEIVKKLAQQESTEMIHDNQINESTVEEFPQLLRAMITKYVNVHRKNAAFIAAIEIAYLSKKETFDDYDQLMEREIKQLTKILARLSQLGHFAERNFEKISKVLIHTIDSIIRRHVSFVKIYDTDEELVNFLVDVILKIIEFQK